MKRARRGGWRRRPCMQIRVHNKPETISSDQKHRHFDGSSAIFSRAVLPRKAHRVQMREGAQVVCRLQKEPRLARGLQAGIRGSGAGDEQAVSGQSAQHHQLACDGMMSLFSYADTRRLWKRHRLSSRSLPNALIRTGEAGASSRGSKGSMFDASLNEIHSHASALTHTRTHARTHKINRLFLLCRLRFARCRDKQKAFEAGFPIVQGK